MQNKALRDLPKSLAISSVTGLAYTFYDYWQFNRKYPNTRVSENTELWQSLERCRRDFHLPANLQFATSQRRILAASSALVFPASAKIVVCEKELRNLSKKTNLTLDEVTSAIVAHEAAHIKENHKFFIISGSVLAQKTTYNLAFLLRYGSLVRHTAALFMFAVANLGLAKASEYRADYVAAQHGEETRQDLTKIFQAISGTSHSIFSAHPPADKRLKNITPKQKVSDTPTCKR